MIKRITSRAKEDGVLTLSFLLAIGTMFIIPPNFNYLSYIDFHTLILLFCLMLIVEGIRQQQFFDFLGNHLIKQTKTTRGIILILVFLTFISSMLITNDVALIIFVPFGLLIVERIGMGTSIPLVVTLMTIAGNLGSMFTPIGNPQNLYLFAQSHLQLHEFLQLMLPYTIAAALLLVVLIYGRVKKKYYRFNEHRRDNVKANPTHFLFWSLFNMSFGCQWHPSSLCRIGFSECKYPKQ